ncbi:MAG: glycosyltransferase family 39 protein [Solirubrobacterales bacterium]|nr:glycosyltransferase family 39 protein [Solirubrobacterales bacterium]
MSTLRTAPAAPPVAARPARAQASGHRAGGSRADVLAVTAPAALALVLCALGLTARSLGFDEAASAAIASQSGSALGRAIAHDGGNMSGYYLVLHLLVDRFGDGLFVLRAAGALATAVTVAVTSLLGLRLFDRRVAALAGVLSAVSLPLVFWGQSARGYAPMVALSTGSFLAFAALIAPDAPGSSPSRARPPVAWLAYVLCTTLAGYAGFVALLIVPAQLLIALWRRRALGSVATALGVAAVAWLPLAVLAVSRGSGQLFWVPRPSLRVGQQVLEAITSAGLEPSFHPAPSTAWLLGLTIVVLAGVAVAFARSPDWRRGLLLSWLFIPGVLAWLESLIGQPLLLPRNLLIVLPAVALLLAVALTDPRLPRAAASGLFTVLIVLRAWPLIAAYGVSPEDWKSATAQIIDRARPGDCIAFYPSDARMAFAYYLPRGTGTGAGAGITPPLPRAVLPTVAWRSKRPFVEAYASIAPAVLRRLPVTCPRLWLVSSHEGQPDGPAPARANLARFHALRGALAGEYARASVTQFGYAAPVTVELLSRPKPSQGRSVWATKVRALRPASSTPLPTSKHTPTRPL